MASAEVEHEDDAQTMCSSPHKDSSNEAEPGNRDCLVKRASSRVTVALIIEASLSIAVGVTHPISHLIHHTKYRALQTIPVVVLTGRGVAGQVAALVLQHC